jgi:hypothetical protein
MEQTRLTPAGYLVMDGAIIVHTQEESVASGIQNMVVNRGKNFLQLLRK